jgi:eukaryotic-like serine/threonine-protein kinase
VSREIELGGYLIVGKLAVGGMAEVYRGRARPTAQRSPDEPEEIVLKRLLPAFRADGAYVKQFLDEARLALRLQHPNIVRTWRCFKAGQDYLMVQELISGRTLAYLQEFLQQARSPMPPAAATYIVWCLLEALEYIHCAKVGEGGANIVHRDVNPANVLLSVQGEVKLTDFGVADVEGQMGGELGALRGTLPYMSPEQVLGFPVDHRADLFSAGIILWELFANRRLYDAANEAELMHQVRDARIPLLRRVVPALPEYAEQILRKALLADRELRFQTAAEFSRALQLLAQRSGWPLSVEALRPLLGR